jgi:hypothetical protein
VTPVLGKVQQPKQQTAAKEDEEEEEEEEEGNAFEREREPWMARERLVVNAS